LWRNNEGNIKIGKKNAKLLELNALKTIFVTDLLLKPACKPF